MWWPKLCELVPLGFRTQDRAPQLRNMFLEHLRGVIAAGRTPVVLIDDLNFFLIKLKKVKINVKEKKVDVTSASSSLMQLTLLPPALEFQLSVSNSRASHAC